MSGDEVLVAATPIGIPDQGDGTKTRPPAMMHFETKMPLCTLLADDHAPARQGLQAISDVAMPLLDGIDTTRQIARRVPGEGDPDAIDSSEF
jgi:hypothetical protein